MGGGLGVHRAEANLPALNEHDINHKRVHRRAASRCIKGDVRRDPRGAAATPLPVHKRREVLGSWQLRTGVARPRLPPVAVLRDSQS